MSTGPFAPFTHHGFYATTIREQSQPNSPLVSRRSLWNATMLVPGSVLVVRASIRRYRIPSCSWGPSPQITRHSSTVSESTVHKQTNRDRKRERRSPLSLRSDHISLQTITATHHHYHWKRGHCRQRSSGYRKNVKDHRPMLCRDAAASNAPSQSSSSSSLRSNNHTCLFIRPPPRVRLEYRWDLMHSTYCECPRSRP
jgi:hypothetical protein